MFGRVGRSPRRREVPLVILAGFVAPYRVPLYEQILKSVPGFQVWVSASSESDREWEPSGGFDFVVKRLRGFSIERARLRRSGQDLHFPLGAFFDLIAVRPQSVISGEFGFRTLSACAYRIVSPSSRLVVWATLSERTERSRSSRRNRLRRGMLRVADAVVVNGSSGAAYIRSLNSEIAVHIVHQATPRPSSPPRPRVAEAKHLSLLFVGQLIERKGLGATIPELAAWAARSDRAVQLTVVGAGPLRATWAELSAETELVIEFRGSLPYDDVLDAYEEADALLFPSLEDEWGLVVNEALQAGRPVVGGVHAQAVQCLVHEGVNGVIFDPDQPAEIHAAMDRLVDLLSGDPAELMATCMESIRGVSIDSMSQGLLDAAIVVKNS